MSQSLKTDYSLYASPFPPIFETTHSYMGNLNLNSITGAVNVWNLRGNSVWDPDQTYTGTTAIGYTILKDIYTNYRVKYSTIKIQLVNQVAGVPIILYLLPSVGVGVYDTLQKAKSTPYFKSIICDGLGGGGNIRTISSTCWAHKILGTDLKDFNLISNTGANPPNQFYWVLGFNSVDGSSSAGATLSYEIYYRTVWTGRKPITT